MIRLFIFLSVSSSILFAQPATVFRISEEDSSYGFVQQDPRLYFAGENTFYVAWEDYRYGNQSFFARKYNHSLNPLCDEFKIFSNRSLVENENGFLLCITERHYDDPFGGGSASSFGAIYNNIIPVNLDFLFYGYMYGWCGTGFTGREDHLLPQKRGFLFFGRYDYESAIIRISESGEILHTRTPFYYGEAYNRIVISTEAETYNDSLNIISWFEMSDYDSLYGPWYGLLDGNDSLVAKYNLNNKVNFHIHGYDFYHLQILKILLLPQNRISLWVFDRLNKKLYWYTIPGIGDEPVVDSLAIQGENDFYEFEDIHFTNIANNNFFIFFSERTYPGLNYCYTGYQFTDTGLYSNFIIRDSSKSKIIHEDINYLGNDRFISAGIANDDIYLYTMSGLRKEDSLRINGDPPNSNERNNQISAFDDQTFFVSWQSGNNAFGRKVSNQGTTISEVIPLAGSSTLFNETFSVNYWNEGIQFMDRDFNIIKTDTLVPLAQGNYVTARILDDSVIIVAFVDSNRIGVRKYDPSGKQLAEAYLIKERKIYYKPAIFVNDDKTFWLNDDYRSLLLVNNKLTILKQSRPLSFEPKIILSDNNTFFGYTWHYNEYAYNAYYTGYLFNDRNDTLQVFEEMPPPTPNFNVHKINEKSFLLMWAINNEIKGKVYHSDGGSQPEFTILPSRDGVSSVDGNFGRTGDKVLFGWSDNLVKQRGYTVQGYTTDTNILTAIEDNKPDIAAAFRLGQAHPNPFNPVTRISYQLQQSGFVTLKIYNTLGQEVATLVNNEQPAGSYTVTFTAGNLSSGLYFYRLQVAGSLAETKKMLLVR